MLKDKKEKVLCVSVCVNNFINILIMRKNVDVLVLIIDQNAKHRTYNIQCIVHKYVKTKFYLYFLSNFH